MKHYNVDILQKVSNNFKPKGELLPDQISEEIVLTYDVTPDTNVILSATCVNATSATIYTTPLDRDFFLKEIQFTYSKDASSTSTNLLVTAIIDNVTKNLYRVNVLTTTATQGGVDHISFKNPIKIDRNTIIAIANDSATANINISATIFGYLVA